jgi:hypothetical protein
MCDLAIRDQIRPRHAIKRTLSSIEVNQAWTAAEMRLASKDGQMFEMRIVGYQFPHLETVEYDSNWLIIAGDVIHPNGSWRFSDPCLLTYEGKRLASWMESIAEGEPVESICGFIEPNLQFRAVLGVDLRVLRVYFELEARPKWAPKRAPKDDLWVEFPVAEVDLRSTARLHDNGAPN